MFPSHSSGRAHRCSASHLLLFGVLLLLSPTGTFAQFLPTLDWEQTYGGPKDDEGFSIVQTPDSGFVLAGYTGNIAETGLPDYHGGFEDAWVLKLDPVGNELWEKCLGGSAQEEANSIVLTKDTGYCVAIRSESWDGDVTGYHGGGSDAWIVRLTAAHQIQWEHNIGGSNWDDPLSLTATTDGGFAFAGYTESNDGDVTGHHGGDTIENDDAWVVKLNDSGTILWQRCLGGLGRDWATGIVQAPDGGYAISGLTNSRDGDVSGFHGGSLDAWVAKLDSVGTLQWQRCLGGDSSDWAEAIALTHDSGFILAAVTASNNTGDVSGYHGDTDAWVVKLSATGTIQWQKCLGGSHQEKAWSIAATADGGYLLGAETGSDDGQVSGNHGGRADIWLVKLDDTGAIQWQRCFGGSNWDQVRSAIETREGFYAFTGFTLSADADIRHNNGNQDILAAELRAVCRRRFRYGWASTVAAHPLPNPAAQTLWVAQDFEAPQALRIEVRNVLGEVVLHLSETAQPGRHTHLPRPHPPRARSLFPYPLCSRHLPGRAIRSGEIKKYIVGVGKLFIKAPSRYENRCFFSFQLSFNELCHYSPKFALSEKSFHISYFPDGGAHT